MRGNITRRGKSSWRLKLDLESTGGQRHTRYVTVRGKRKDAERELTRLIATTDNGSFVEPTKVTVADYLRVWLSGPHGLAGKTAERYRQLAEQQIIPHLGALPLQKLCKTQPPILGLASAPTARSTARFTPDRELKDGERLVLSPQAPADKEEAAAHTHTLRVVHTPGHAANHLCLVLEEDALLFSGDHVLNGSTTVVDPPDGNMNAYLDSLDKLDATCAAGGVAFILPAHGYVLGEARAAIAYLKAHRLKREAKIAAAMRQLPEGTPEDWLPIAYSDVPERMWPVAARSLAAHVERIQQLTQP